MENISRTRYARWLSNIYSTVYDDAIERIDKKAHLQTLTYNKKKHYSHLNVPVCEQILDKCSVNSGHASVVDGKPIWEQILQLCK